VASSQPTKATEITSEIRRRPRYRLLGRRPIAADQSFAHVVSSASCNLASGV
jgi:hypothetical protein